MEEICEDGVSVGGELDEGLLVPVQGGLEGLVCRGGGEAQHGLGLADVQAAREDRGVEVEGLLRGLAVTHDLGR